ncbi:choline-binding protein Cbp8 [Streptococcus mitis]|uniref:Choline-binding protein Cbp8 n=1 Tax=Streptococcus mitis TaxID=28037 RepID=A0A4U9XUH8_STRMT|nr:choline-binding protein Cbp8 [Streptococcus mitis]
MKLKHVLAGSAMGLSLLMAGVGNVWYYLNGSGDMNKGGWSKVEKSWYYFTNSGALLVNTTTPDGYRVNSNGEWV